MMGRPLVDGPRVTWAALERIGWPRCPRRAPGSPDHGLLLARSGGSLFCRSNPPAGRAAFPGCNTARWSDCFGSCPPADDADVARPGVLPFDDEAVPAVLREVGNRQRSDRDGAHPSFRMDAGMAGYAVDLDFEIVRAGRADAGGGGRAPGPPTTQPRGGG